MTKRRSDSSPQLSELRNRQTVLCLGGHVVTIDEERFSPDWDGGNANVSVDLAEEHDIVYPGWQALRIGVTGGSALLLWSARDLWVLDTRRDKLTHLFAADEDIRFVHALPDGVLVVCETSLRTVNRTGEQVSRLELPEVAEKVTLDGSNVTVRNGAEGEWLVAMNGLHLVAASREERCGQ